MTDIGFPGGASGKEPTCQCRRHKRCGFNCWVRKISWSLLKFMFIESVMPSNHLTLFRPLFLLPSLFPSIRVFSNELALRIRWPNYWSFSFSISPSNEYSGLISFRMDRFDLLAVQGTLKSLLQYHSSKASILLCSQSQTTSQSDHTDHSLSNSVKLSHAVWGHPRRMGHDGEV